MKFPTVPSLALSVAACLALPAHGGEVVVTMLVAATSGAGAPLGHIRVVETRYGLVFHPSLDGLSPGLHGFHVHEKPSCAPMLKDGEPVAALAAGPHLDPEGSNRHGEPWGDGHLGDLPALHVDADGKATNPVLAPRLKLADVLNRSLMVHAGGDNHSDHPAPLGGGGARIACGVIAGH